MKVGAILPAYPPASRVGAWLATHEFLAELVRRGHDVTVWRKGFDYDLDGVKVRGQLGQIDLLVSHATGPGAAVKCARDRNVPHVRFVHGPGSDRPDHADMIVVSSEAAMIPGAVVCRPPTWADQHRSVRGESITLVNLSKKKGVMTAWRAAEHLESHAFLGVRGAYGAQQQPRCNNFKVIDTQRDMRAVWSQTRVLLMPSLSETWGMVGVEAMCSGIPVIAHPSPGLHESLGAAGIFVDRTDIDGWVQAIRSLDDPDYYAERSAASLARFDEIDPHEGLNLFAETIEGLV